MKVPRQKRSVMDASIGVNLRVTAHSNQGGRKYMEDMFCVAYQPTSDEKDLLYAYFGIFDGHGGREAAFYAKTHLMDHIVSQKNFWSDDDELVMKAIRDGFISVHHAMWRELDKWPKTQSGLPSTSGTTASVAFVRRGKLYIGHVGDSGIVLGYQDPDSSFWKARPLTNDHKPESPQEHARIQECGGKVVSKSGVPRVVWNRPRIGHQGPVRRSTLIDEIPFLAVARSLGDLWSYNSEQNEFVVSPVPDVSVIDIDVNTHRCLILGSDGLWNMLTCQDAVNSVYFAEKNNEKHHQIAAAEGTTAGLKNWINPSKRLVDRALDRWYGNNLRADNTSVVTVVIDPPGPPKKQPSPRQSNASSSTSPSLNSNVHSPRPCAHTSIHPSTPSPRFRQAVANSRYSTPTSPPRSVARPQGTLDKVGRPKAVGRASMPSPGTSPTSVSREIPARRPDRTNRGNKIQPLVSSKTSRVLARQASSTDDDSSESDRTSLASNQPLSDNHDNPLEDTVNKDDVQIHEISSSCETDRAEGAEAGDSLSTVETPPKSGGKRMRKINKRMPKSTATAPATNNMPVSTSSASSRKRLARNNENNADEPITQRKIMKVSNEAVSVSGPSTSLAKKGLTTGKGKDVIGKLRNRGKVAPATRPTTSRISRTATNIADSKENGKKLARRLSVPAVSTRTTRGNAAKEVSVVEPSTADEAVVSSGTLESSKKLVKPVDTTVLQSQTDGGRVTNKKPLRNDPQQTSESVESQEIPSTSKRQTRGGSGTVVTTTTSAKPLKLVNAISNTAKRDTLPSIRQAKLRTSRGNVTELSSPTKKGIRKTKLNRLNKKVQKPDKVTAPSGRTKQGKKLETTDEETGASRERNLRSSSSSALRVTRSKKKM